MGDYFIAGEADPLPKSDVPTPHEKKVVELLEGIRFRLGCLLFFFVAAAVVAYFAAAIHFRW